MIHHALAQREPIETALPSRPAPHGDTDNNHASIVSDPSMNVDGSVGQAARQARLDRSKWKLAQLAQLVQLVQVAQLSQLSQLSQLDQLDQLDQVSGAPYIPLREWHGTGAFKLHSSLFKLLHSSPFFKLREISCSNGFFAQLWNIADVVEDSRPARAVATDLVCYARQRMGA